MKLNFDHLADAIYLKSTRDLEKHTRNITHIREQIALLMEKKRGGGADFNSSETCKFEGEVEFRWHRWIDSKIEALNLELSRELAERPRILKNARRGFGKMQSLKKVSSLQQAELDIVQSRRDTYES